VEQRRKREREKEDMGDRWTGNNVPSKKQTDGECEKRMISLSLVSGANPFKGSATKVEFHLPFQVTRRYEV
jgi:hypothetical protein